MQQSSDLADIHFVRQGEPKGLGHAVLPLPPHVGDHPIAVLLGDDLIDERDTLLSRMLGEYEKRGATVIALMEVDPEHIHLYGTAAVEATEDPDVVRVTGLVEKPEKEDAPSNLAIIGRYVLDPRCSTCSNTPSRARAARSSSPMRCRRSPNTEDGGVYGVVFRGRRYDTGESWSTSRPSCSSRPTGTTSAPICGRGSRSSPQAS